MKKYQIILISLAVLFLIMGVVSAVDDTSETQNVTHPITTIIGGFSVSDQNTATIVFKDDMGEVIDGKTSVTVNGKSISASGSLSISVSLPTDVASISISNGATAVGVKKVSTSVSSSFHTDINKNSKSFSVILKDSKGNPIKNKQVTVSINGNSKTVNTDTNGRILVSVNVPSYAESSDVSYSSTPIKSDDISKKPVASKIKASKKTFKVKTKTKKFPITLTDKKSKAIAGKKVTLTVNGKSYTAKTGNDGKATFKITKLNKKGTYKASVKFAGDKSYASSSAAPKIVVKK